MIKRPTGANVLVLTLWFVQVLMYRNEEGDEAAEEERAWLASASSATAAAATRGKL